MSALTFGSVLVAVGIDLDKIHRIDKNLVHPSYTDKKVLRPNFPRVTLTKMVQWPNLNNW